jgi:lipopolysaccharide transport system ATP-binding protein
MSAIQPGSIICDALGKRYAVPAVDPGASRFAGRRKSDFWALKDVSVDVHAGEVLGIVGRNGAGKSTLLKILSKITQPTEGRAMIAGRISGLLEVGTGFHPELTGRENVFLNGTMLGMSKQEVLRQFDAIVEFSGIEAFLATPVKRYSSGMYVRLAFAVAAHLRSEILVLDEVLAVGDAAFQRKCLGKVHELAHDEGRTVLLVSHNAEVIREHATRAIRLDHGRLIHHGSVKEVLDDYASHYTPHAADVASAVRVDPNWGKAVRILKVEFDRSGEFRMGEEVTYSLELSVSEPLELGVGQAIITPDDRPIATSFSDLVAMPAGRSSIRVTLHAPPLAPGPYSMNVVVGRSSFAAPDLHYDGVMHAAGFEIHPPTDELVDWHPEWWGQIALSPPELMVRNETSAQR